MHSQSTVLHARELRRHDFLEDAARHRLAAVSLPGTSRRALPGWPAWMSALPGVLGNGISRLRLLSHTRPRVGGKQGRVVLAAGAE